MIPIHVSYQMLNLEMTLNHLILCIHCFFLKFIFEMQAKILCTFKCWCLLLQVSIDDGQALFVVQQLVFFYDVFGELKCWYQVSIDDGQALFDIQQLVFFYDVCGEFKCWYQVSIDDSQAVLDIQQFVFFYDVCGEFTC